MPSNSLRVALLSDHASPLADLGSVDAGGQNVYVNQVARQLSRLGHRVDVFTRRDDAVKPSCVNLCANSRVLHVRAGPMYFVPKEHLLPHMHEFTRSTERYLRASAPYDVVHANFFMSGLVGMQLKRRFGVPLVTTFHALGLVRRQHQGDADSFPACRIEIERRIVQTSDRLIAECPQDKSDLQQLYQARPERIATVPCGVDTHMFTPGSKLYARRKLGVPEDAFIILQLGRLVPRKGIDNVIQALALLPASMKAHLLVVGGNSRRPDPNATPEMRRLMTLAQEAGVASHVTFTGHRQRDELRDYFVAADVFVTTPWYEPFGITPLEAMACGVPVIGAKVGGIQYSVKDGVTGYLVPPRDPAALAQRLMDLHDNPAHAAAMGRAGIQRVRSRFTWKRVAEALLDVYADIKQRHTRADVSNRIDHAVAEAL